MFKNSVFKPSVDTIEWWKKAGVRAIKTMAQGAITLIGSDKVNIVSLNWGAIIGICATMGLLSILSSVAGIPEVPSKEE